ncbi:MAG: hypothetical protein CMM67_04795 [Rhodospirillaceae bacterium]|nr:hypothetical protein [Rhodospirillaceae bacterium]MAV87545.1 hypothetical protein [Rhodospirillaceae bacterium]OUT79007.1 MAG: hypothetical protein CBB83_04980 [Rhodospirillaceae bacterium TMED23]|tara:strand:- start:211 stop:453 length:243 start_codon:yes stop_codon:yes gene_type:complete
MVELLRTNDIVLISWISSILAEEGIKITLFDNHMSILEGSAFAIPRRVMVYHDDLANAQNIFENAVESRGGDVGYFEYPK